jgi:inosine-uridine nucleoside N-ribohydrolase
MKKIWIDCDPGIDDAVALAFAAAHTKELKILGISTVAGNQTLEKVTGNAAVLLEYYGLSVPVAAGAESPLVGPLLTGEDAHGESGLGNAEVPNSSREPEQEKAWDFIYRVLIEQMEKVTFIATGPLTNLAMLFKLYPDCNEYLEEIVFMGGAAWGGNVTAAAEFNIYVDPEAAKIVLDAGVPTVMCGLDVTNQCGLTRRQIAKLCQTGGKICRLCGDMMGYSMNLPVHQILPVIPVHDAVPFMYLLHPEMFGGEKLPVDVDCSMGIGRGQTVCDRRYLLDEDDLHVKVLLKADGKAFQEYLIEGLFELDTKFEE